MRLLLLAVFVLHGVLGAAIGLSVDEAHYALYAAHPALSYFDHPPLVGWVQWPLVAVQAPEGILRLVPGLLWLVTVAGVYRLTLRLTPRLQGAGAGREVAGLWAMLTLLLAPLLHILGIGLLPDTLLIALTVALMHQTLTLMESANPTSIRQWLLLGLLLGLAGLSKYTAIFTALAVALCLLQTHGMRLLRAPGVWLAVLVALLMISPVLLWNAQNQWVSFRYQTQHGAGGVWQLQHVLRFLLVQLVVFGPMLLWGLAGVRLHAENGHRWLVLFFAMPFAVLAYLSGGGTSLPHWTAPAWVALAPFAGLALERFTQTRWRRPIVGLAILQGLLCIALPALMLTGGIPFVEAKAPASNRAPNPFADLHGWDQAGAHARTLASQHNLSSVSVQNWTLASRLGWYARPLKVHVLEDRFDQFALWAGDLPKGGDTLLVDWSEMAYALPLGAHGFANCQLLETLPVLRLGRPLSEFRFYACQGWSGAPQPRLLSEVTAP
ncbi:MAG: glycosyltransferase family 39 protein [Burkholderiales bacterium]|nr:glycosyltransferase family 39 protein [Burkholderiales bacterium]